MSRRSQVYAFQASIGTRYTYICEHTGVCSIIHVFIHICICSCVSYENKHVHMLCAAWYSVIGDIEDKGWALVHVRGR